MQWYAIIVESAVNTLGRRIVIAVLTAFSSFGACLVGQTSISQADTSFSSSDVTWASQGWSKKTRDFYHFAPQGTYLTESKWFVALELPDSTTLISDPVYLTSLGLLVEPKSPVNPLGLPVGLAVGRAPSSNMISVENSVGITCALCHTGQLSYSGKTVRFDGLGSVADVTSFVDALSSSIMQTYSNEEKWDRFSRRVLGNAYNKSSNEKLRTAFSAQVSNIEWTQNSVDSSTIYPVVAGYGRNDAIASGPGHGFLRQTAALPIA